MEYSLISDLSCKRAEKFGFYFGERVNVQALLKALL